MNFYKKLKKLGNAITDLVFPIYCIVCWAEKNTYLCAHCAETIKRLKSQKCIACSKPAAFGKTHPSCATRNVADGIISALDYSDKAVKEVVKAFKYKFVASLNPSLSHILQNLIKSEGISEYFQGFEIVPVPLHKKRFAWRGFNQSLLIAQVLGKEFNLPINDNLAMRIKNTKPQAKLKKEQRQKNISQAFKATSKALGKYLLVDDVSASGFTINELAKTLKSAGAAEVWAITLAQG